MMKLNKWLTNCQSENEKPLLIAAYVVLRRYIKKHGITIEGLMKITILISTILILFQPFNLYAQKSYAIDKGSVHFNGGVNFSVFGGEIYQGSDIVLMNIKFNMLTFVIRHLAIGPVLYRDSYSHRGGSSSSHSFEAGPSIAYYFGDEKSKNLAFVSNSLMRGSQTGRKTLSYRLSGGINYLITRNVAVTFEGFYTIRYHSQNNYNWKNCKRGYVSGFEVGISLFIF